MNSIFKKINYHEMYYHQKIYSITSLKRFLEKQNAFKFFKFLILSIIQMSKLIYEKVLINKFPNLKSASKSDFFQGKVSVQKSLVSRFFSLLLVLKVKKANRFQF